MIKNLKLITTETFGDLPCNFYRNMNDDILLTREQIGQALEYKRPDDAIYRIHKRHQERLDNLSICLSDGLGHEIYYYNERGIMEICRWSNSNKANLFMDWVWDIIGKYRHNELQPDLKPLTDTLSSITTTLTTLTQTMTTMQQDIEELKQSQQNRYLSEKQHPSAWYKKMAPKYKMLMEYFDCTRNELYSNIYKELEDTCDVDINQIYEDYCYGNHLCKDECYPMSAIEHDTRLREALTLLIDSSLVKYGLQTEEEIKHFKRKTLFDREPIMENNQV